MFTTLVESKARTAKRAAETMTSLLLHGALIAGAVALTLPKRGDATPDRHPPVLTYLNVASRVREHVRTPAPATPHLAQNRLPGPILIAPTHVPTTIEPVEIGGPALPAPESIGGGIITSPERVGPGLVAPDGVYDAERVERAPTVLGTPPVPRYPDPLRQAGISGNVVVRFVVDTLGRAEMDGVVVQEATHALFADAVRSALMRFRFTPGETGGRKVRTLVQVPFAFTLR